MNTEKMLNHAYAHELEDGLAELWLGVLLMGVGTLRALIHFTDANSAKYYWIAAGLFLFMFACSWAGTRVVRRLKERIAYPRTGYTAFKPRSYSIKKIVSLLFIAGIIGGAAGIASSQPNEHWAGWLVPLGQGAVVAAAFAYVGHRVEIRRYYYLAFFSLAIGALLGALSIGIVLCVSFFYLTVGVALFASGGLAMVQFLRNHKPVDLSREN